MDKKSEIQLSAVIKSFKSYAQSDYLGVYISEIEKGTLEFPELIFALNKLIEYCDNNAEWQNEKDDLLQIVAQITSCAQQEEESEKNDLPINRFWVSFYEWYNSELPASEWIYPRFVEYNNWNQGTYYLNINYDSLFRRFLGVPYDNRYDDKDHCKFEDVKILIELLYRELIQVKSRYEFTVFINRMFQKFSLPYDLKNGKVTKKGYKTTDRGAPIINYQMFESKIQWSEEKILGTEGLDKHTALNYITDALQYLFSLINHLDVQELANKKVHQRCALLVNDDASSKTYSVILNEINEIQSMVNEYFDIRHNEYLSKISKTKREALSDLWFIEYLYNRIYGLVQLIKVKYAVYLQKERTGE
jgi:hypothetical protein